MPEETNRIAITTIGSVPVAIEISSCPATVEEDSSYVEMIASGQSISERIGDLSTLINKTATVLVDSIVSIAESSRPKKVEVELSFSFSAEGGFWYIAKGSASSGIKIKLEWQLERK